MVKKKNLQFLKNRSVNNYDGQIRRNLTSKQNFQKFSQNRELKLVYNQCLIIQL